MGSISRMKTTDRFLEWAEKNDALPDVDTTLIIIDGGIPYLHQGKSVAVLDIDNLSETEETEEDYKNAIYNL